MSRYVVYTAAFGKGQRLFPQPSYTDIDFICFTDDPKLKAKGWLINVVTQPDLESHRLSRYYKILPHKCVTGYEASIYIDANFIAYNDPTPIFKQLEEQNHLFAAFDHADTLKDPRNCIYKEMDAIKQKQIVKKERFFDNEDVLEKHLNFLKKENYPKDNGLISGGVLYRQHNHPKVVELMESWWYMILNYSRRDQLSFNFVAWKHNFSFPYFEGDIRRQNPFFYMVSKREKNKLWQTLKYTIRIRKLKKKFSSNSNILKSDV